MVALAVSVVAVAPEASAAPCAKASYELGKSLHQTETHIVSGAGRGVRASRIGASGIDTLGGGGLSSLCSGSLRCLSGCGLPSLVGGGSSRRSL